METVQSLKKNDRICLHLHSNRKIECDFVSGDSHGISATNCFDLTTKKLRKIVQKFYRSDIKSIENLKQQATISTSDGEHVEPIVLTEPHAKQRCKKVFSQTEIEQINWLIDNGVYITQRDENYFAAIDLLKCQDHVGFQIENQSSIGAETAFLVTFGTTTKVFTFDLLQCDEMYLGLRDILESDQVKKIVYDVPTIVTGLRGMGKELKLNGMIDVKVVIQYFHFL